MSLSTFSLQSVQPKAGTPGVSQEAAGSSGSSGQGGPPTGSSWIMMMPLLMIVPLLFMQMRRQKKETTQRAGLKKGDRVVTNAGLIGELIELDAQVAKVKIAPGTTVSIVANTISPFETEAPKLVSDTDKAAADKK